MTCSTCHYWEEPVKEGEPGYCHREPPKAFMVVRPAHNGLKVPGASQSETTLMTSFPPTTANVWCGEYQEG